MGWKGSMGDTNCVLLGGGGGANIFSCVSLSRSYAIFKATFSVHKITTKNTPMPALHVYTN